MCFGLAGWLSSKPVIQEIKANTVVPFMAKSVKSHTITASICYESRRASSDSLWEGTRHGFVYQEGRPPGGHLEGWLLATHLWNLILNYLLKRTFTNTDM